MKQIDLLDKNKSNSGNIPTGMLKAKRKIVCPYLTDCINSAVYDCNFPNELKEADITPLFKMMIRIIREILGQLVFYLQPPKYMKDF